MVAHDDLVIVTLELIDIIEEMQEYTNCNVSTNQKVQNMKRFIINEHGIIKVDGSYRSVNY